MIVVFLRDFRGTVGNVGQRKAQRGQKSGRLTQISTGTAQKGAGRD